MACLLNITTLCNYRLEGMNDEDAYWIPSGAHAGDMIPLNSEDGSTGLFAELKECERTAQCNNVCADEHMADSLLKCVSGDCINVLSVRVCVAEADGIAEPIPPFSKIYRNLTTQEYTLAPTGAVFVGYSLNTQTLPANCAFEIGQ